MAHRGDSRALAALATRQNGNVTHRQLLAAGLSRDEIVQRYDVGWLIRRHTGVFAVGHVPAGRESAWHAAVLALGDGAALSHTSAAALWRMVSGTAVTEVIVPTQAGHPKRDGIVVHRQPLADAHATTHLGVPVTTPIRTLLDLAAVAPLGVLFRAFEQAQVRLNLPPAPLAAEVIRGRGSEATGSCARFSRAPSTRPTSARSSSCDSSACALHTASSARSSIRASARGHPTSCGPSGASWWRRTAWPSTARRLLAGATRRRTRPCEPLA